MLYRVAIAACAALLLGVWVDVNAPTVGSAFCDTVAGSPDFCEDFEENQSDCALLTPDAPIDIGAGLHICNSAPALNENFEGFVGNDGNNGHICFALSCGVSETHCEVRIIQALVGSYTSGTQRAMLRIESTGGAVTLCSLDWRGSDDRLRAKPQGNNAEGTPVPFDDGARRYMTVIRNSVTDNCAYTIDDSEGDWGLGLVSAANASGTSTNQASAQVCITDLADNLELHLDDYHGKVGTGL